MPAALGAHVIFDNYTDKTPAEPPMVGATSAFHVHFTPTGTSWINLVERWFAALTDKQLRHGVHRSTRELEMTIGRSIDITKRTPQAVRVDQDHPRIPILSSNL